MLSGRGLSINEVDRVGLVWGVSAGLGFGHLYGDIYTRDRKMDVYMRVNSGSLLSFYIMS